MVSEVQIPLFFVFLLSLSAKADINCELFGNSLLICTNATIPEITTALGRNATKVTLQESLFPKITTEMMRNLPNVEEFNADPVGIEEFDDDAFQNCTNLKKIIVNDNKIKRVPSDLIKDIQVEELDLKGNKGIKIPEKKPFLVSDSLKVLRLESCEVKELYPETFEKLPLLQFLIVPKNNLKTLPVGVFSQTGGLVFLDLSDNKLETFSKKVVEPFSERVIVDFSGNPWVCDCNLIDLILWAREQGVENQVTCGQPSKQHWKEIRNGSLCQE